MKKIIMKKVFVLPILILLVVTQSCSLKKAEFSKISPNDFYKTQKDAKLAVAALYYNSITKISQWAPGLFVQNINSVQEISDIAAGDMMMCSYGPNPWDYLRNHQWTATNGYGTNNFFHYYSDISQARIVANRIKQMNSIPDDLKSSLVAEALAIAGWKAAILYDLYGPVPYPMDEMLKNPADLAYPERPSNEEFVKIIEGLFSKKDKLMPPDFGSNFGRMNKGIANFVLMRLYMLEAGRTGDANFWKKAKKCAEDIIASGSYKLQDNYKDIFSVSNQKNKEIVFASPSTYSFNVNMWHSEVLPNNFPCALNEGAGSWGGYKILWSFYDTFDPDDQRLSGIAASYTTKDGLVIDREHPHNDRHGVGDGAIPVKYELDPNEVGNVQGQDWIVYRYAEVLLSMSEILNELGTTSNVNAPAITHTANDGQVLHSDGGNTAFSFINAIRVRAGLHPFSGLSKSDLRDSILMERGHELYCEGTRRMDLIRYQRVTDGNGYKKFDSDTDKFLFPIPEQYINEYEGHLKQNPGY